MNTVTKFAILNANYPAGAGRLVSSLAPPEWSKLGKIGDFLRKMAKSDASAGSFLRGRSTPMVGMSVSRRQIGRQRRGRGQRQRQNFSSGTPRLKKQLAETAAKGYLIHSIRAT
ncbi:MAG TPA: hypothetical protein VFC17_09415 [Candidatus Limnocylindrales bacterium]|nr:hypothetical protein [Candidatus Limnocylindrales bacterium]